MLSFAALSYSAGFFLTALIAGRKTVAAGARGYPLLYCISTSRCSDRHVVSHQVMTLTETMVRSSSRFCFVVLTEDVVTLASASSSRALRLPTQGTRTQSGAQPKHRLNPEPLKQYTAYLFSTH